jgi:Zn-dependent membrane protease YugP
MIEHDLLGFAIPCGVTDTVCLSYFFYSPIKRMALVEGTSVAVILGHVIAHEIGHALLDSKAHTHQGIMQGKLPIADLERFLYFTSQLSKHIVASLVARNQLQKK